jgi:hypothetical protein
MLHMLMMKMIAISSQKDKLTVTHSLSCYDDGGGFCGRTSAIPQASLSAWRQGRRGVAYALRRSFNLDAAQTPHVAILSAMWRHLPWFRVT